MDLNRHIIRGYDIRGIVGEDLSEDLYTHLGRAYGTIMKKGEVKTVVVGADCRETSDLYKAAFIRGIHETGLDTIDIGMVLVGRVYWAQYYFNTKGAAMITASHNPKEFNGIKLASDFSESLIAKELQDMADIVEKEDYSLAETHGTGKEEDITETYFTNLIERCAVSKPFTVVIDPSCTTAGAIIPNLLRQAGCTVIEQNCEVSGKFPLGVADPTEEVVAKRLAEGVVTHKADIGFSYDADGDRIGIVDETGQIIWNDVLVALFAKDILHTYPGSPIMYNTLCSKLVSDTIIAEGGKPFMWRTGHGFLKKKNQDVGAPFIGELSGHFFFSKDFYNHDDGCYATLRLLNYLSKTGKTLSEEIAALPQYISSPEIKLYCAEDKKVALIGKIKPVLESDYPNAEIIDDERAGDGIRLELPDSMFVIRYSQNGPYITIKFEGKTEAQYTTLKNYINTLLHTFEEVDWNHAICVNKESVL